MNVAMVSVAVFICASAAGGSESTLSSTPLNDARCAYVTVPTGSNQQEFTVSVPTGFQPHDCLRCTATHGRVAGFASNADGGVTVEFEDEPMVPGSVIAFFWKPNRGGDVREYFVASDGRPENDGSRGNPWDMRSALDGTQTVAPGSLIWFEGGTYSDPLGDLGLERSYLVALSGEEGRPIHIAPLPGVEVTIKGGFRVESQGWLWIGGFEFRNDDPVPGGEPTPGGTIPDPIPAGFDEWGGAGVAVMSGPGHVIYNNVTSGGSHAYSAWNQAPGTRFLANVAFGAGWIGADRAHGHCIYAQNAPGTEAKWLRHNLFEIRSRWPHGNYGLHLYVKSTELSGFNIWENAIRGPVTVQSGIHCEQIDFRNNRVASANPGATAIEDSKGNSFGRPDRPDRDITIENNAFVNGVTRIDNNAWESIEAADNRVVKTDDSWWIHDIGTPPALSVRESGEFVDYTDEGRDEFEVWPNEIDLARAHVAVFDFDHDGSVLVDLNGFLSPGDRFRAHHFKRVPGEPQLTGVFAGEPVSLDVDVPGDVLDMFVVFRNR